MSSILFTTEGGVARITLNRPGKRNALNAELVAELKDALNAASAGGSVRVIVLAGAGKDFCAGADLAALQSIAAASVNENLRDAESLMELFLIMRNAPKPIVAAVRGRALAGGCGLATACDLVLASKTAQFGYPEVKIGFVPAMVMAILRRNIGEKRAFELITRGEVIGAERAAELGLVNQVFEDQDFEQSAEAYLAVFTKLSASAVSLSKQLLYGMDTLDFASALRQGATINTIARFTPDCRSEIEKFLNKG